MDGMKHRYAMYRCALPSWGKLSLQILTIETSKKCPVYSDSIAISLYWYLNNGTIIAESFSKWYKRLFSSKKNEDQGVFSEWTSLLKYQF